MQQYDYAIIGGGIVGLSVAWTILERQPRARVVVMEKETDWCQHQTGRNSGVIHSGIYYRPGSFKARLCREGNRRLREFCDRHGIHHEVCGKVIAATTQSEFPLLHSLYQRGIENGLSVKRMNGLEIKELEPHVNCLAGLHVPATGIVNYTEVCRKLVELIAGRGGNLLLNTEVLAHHANGVSGVLETTQGEFSAGWAISCSGLQSDRVVHLAGSVLESRIIPFRGEYYELKPDRRQLVRNLIYPVPDPQFPFLGVHFTRMIDGGVHAGPNAVLSLKREGYHRTAFNFRDFMETMLYPGFWRMALNHAKTGFTEMHRSFSKKAFVRSLQKLVPEICENDLIPCAAGVRAQAVRPDGGFVDDFLMVRGHRILHVCNAPSPAATASLAIGEWIVKQVPEY